MSLTQTVLLWAKTLFLGFIVLLSILKDIFKLGPRKVFTWTSPKKPSCLDDPIFGVHAYLHLQDVRIHYVTSGPEDKPLMLFVHGFPEFWYSWRHQIKEFQKDYRVVAIDQRGYGSSDKPKGKDAYTVKILISDIKQVIEALGYKSCILVAHDWGGIVAWSFARHHPDFVDKLIVMNVPPIPVFRELIQTSSIQRKMSWYVYFYQLPWLPELAFKTKNYAIFDRLFASCKNVVTSEDIDAYKYTFSQPGVLTSSINYYRAFIQKPETNATHDLNYSMPVLLIWGLKDLALCSAFPDKIKQYNPRITVACIPDAGHFVQADVPELVNKTMAEWLQDKREL